MTATGGTTRCRCAPRRQHRSKDCHRIADHHPAASRRSRRAVGQALTPDFCGFGGNDKIVGGKGNDLIFAGSGDDQVSAGKGADVIRAGPGKDKVSGGKG